jgi:hypothetical protein
VREQGAMDFSAFSGEEFDAKVCQVCVPGMLRMCC